MKKIIWVIILVRDILIVFLLIENNIFIDYHWKFLIQSTFFLIKET